MYEQGRTAKGKKTESSVIVKQFHSLSLLSSEIRSIFLRFRSIPTSLPYQGIFCSVFFFVGVFVLFFHTLLFLSLSFLLFFHSPASLLTDHIRSSSSSGISTPRSDRSQSPLAAAADLNLCSAASALCLRFRSLCKPLNFITFINVIFYH